MANDRVYEKACHAIGLIDLSAASLCDEACPNEDMRAMMALPTMYEDYRGGMQRRSKCVIQ